jgi:hypothetical protein
MFISKIGAGVAVGAALVLIAGTAQAQGGWTAVTIPPATPTRHPTSLARSR